MKTPKYLTHFFLILQFKNSKPLYKIFLKYIWKDKFEKLQTLKNHKEFIVL